MSATSGPLDRQGGRAETEQVDDEDRRHPAKEIGVGDRERPERKENRPGQASQHGDPERGEQDHAFAIRKILTLSGNARAMLGNELLKTSRSKNDA